MIKKIIPALLLFTSLLAGSFASPALGNSPNIPARAEYTATPTPYEGT